MHAAQEFRLSLSHLLAQLRDAAQDLCSTNVPDDAPCTLFFSASDRRSRAHTVGARGKTFDQAWTQGSQKLLRVAIQNKLQAVWLRVDRVDDVKPIDWKTLREQLAGIRRNYVPFGIAFDADLTVALLEEELGAYALLYDNTEPCATPHAGNLRAYGKRRYNRELTWPENDDTPMWVFTTQAVFGDGRSIHKLAHTGAFRGYREVDDWDAQAVRTFADSATNYLARQVKSSGEYQYGWFPCFDKPIPTYNALRHASSTYALLEGWELTQDEGHRQAIDRALKDLTGRLIKPTTLPDGREAAFLVDTGNEIKLGGNAVCLLALVKYTELTGDRQYLPLLERLAVGVLHMQQPDGRFVHVLNHPDLSVKAQERIIYYDGEAAFGLMRLYGLTNDARWLACVERAFEHFIAARHWKAHDHWLSYCVNELTRYRPEERYYRFGLDNVQGHLDFVLERITTYPTLLELMMAAQQMIERLQADTERAQLLKEFDLDKFYRALEFRARYLLNGHFWPELAMFFQNPARIVGSFHIRHHSFRVRIDDVEHYLSGYVAYLKYLNQRGMRPPSVAGIIPEDPMDNTVKRLQTAPLQDSQHPVVAWGGDVNLGRRQHYLSAENPGTLALDVAALRQADVAIVNLECVVATQGEQGFDKGEGGPFYYRGRPDMLPVLLDAGIDAVAVANNHTGDYGLDALLEQAQWLERAGLAHAGSGHDTAEAFRPMVLRAGDLDVAVFSIDATQYRYAAQEKRPGIAYLDIKQHGTWRARLEPLFSQARQNGQVVLVAMHWGDNWAAIPSEDKIAAGHALIDAGADAVMGASAHGLQGIDTYRGKPVIHDAGDLLFDTKNKAGIKDGGVFSLHLDHGGVYALSLIHI